MMTKVGDETLVEILSLKKKEREGTNIDPK